MPIDHSGDLAGKMTDTGQQADFGSEGLILRFHEKIPSTPEAVEGLVEKLCEVASEMECAPGELEKVELALQEALNNAVLHGNKSDPDKKISVTCHCQEDKGILIVVRDSGPGFDPSNIPDPTQATNIYSSHGRGVFLIQQLMDEVSFEDGGRAVVMKKNGKKAGS
jgi:serine/threonine-protein kinase RsbW